MAHPPSDLLTTGALAKAVGMERSTLVRWVQTGRVRPSSKLPGPTGAYLFSPSDAALIAELWAVTPKRRAS